jgi:DNA recombination-dependent growth factor C
LAKKSDTRRDKFVEKNGDICVELDALPANVLRQRIEEEVSSRMDLAELRQVKETEQSEIKRIIEIMQEL